MAFWNFDAKRNLGRADRLAVVCEWCCRRGEQPLWRKGPFRETQIRSELGVVFFPIPPLSSTFSQSSRSQFTDFYLLISTYTRRDRGSSGVFHLWLHDRNPHLSSLL